MTAKTKTTSTRTDYDRAAQDAAKWAEHLADAREALERIDTTPATSPEEARKAAHETAAAREYVTRCEVALGAAIERRDAAARAVVAAEADALEPEAEALRAKIAEHDRRTEELLEPLRAHTGRDWAEVDPLQEWRDHGRQGVVTIPPGARDKLTAPLRAVEAQQKALRHAADGGDPAEVCRAEDLPDSLKPGGVLPSATLTERARQAAEDEAARAEHEAQLAHAQRTLNAAVRALGVDVTVEADAVAGEWATHRGRQWAQRYGASVSAQEKYADPDAWSEKARHLETIAALAGWENASRVAASLKRHPDADNGAA